MMTLAISPRDKRVLIAGAAALTLIVGLSRFTGRAVAWSSDARRSAASLVAEVGREEASIRALPLTRDSLVARRVRLIGLDSTILDGDNPPLAAAALAELVSDAAETAKAQLGNVQVRADSVARGTFVPVQIQTSVTGDLPALARFLSRLEEGPKTIALRELSLSAALDQSPVPGRRELIRADVVIEGLARNQPAHSRAR